MTTTISPTSPTPEAPAAGQTARLRAADLARCARHPSWPGGIGADPAGRRVRVHRPVRALAVRRSSSPARRMPCPATAAGLLGTDALGRDVFARLLDGGWSLLLLAAISTVSAVLLGAVAGVMAAYRGRRTETGDHALGRRHAGHPAAGVRFADRQRDRRQGVAAGPRGDAVPGTAGGPRDVRRLTGHLRTRFRQSRRAVGCGAAHRDPAPRHA